MDRCEDGRRKVKMKERMKLCFVLHERSLWSADYEKLLSRFR